MASSSSYATASNPLLGVQITEKLTKTNYVLWQAQVLTAIRGARMEGHITSKSIAPATEVEEKLADGKTIKVPNPAHEEWFARDQQVLGLIFSSVGKEIFIQIAAARTAVQAWREVEKMFTAQSRAKTMNVRLAMTTTRKGTMSITDYFAMMKGYADEMAAAGKPLEDEEVVFYICNGLDAEFNPAVTSLVTWVEPISVSELYSQLLSFENRLDLQEGTGSVNNIQHGGRGASTGSGSGGRGGGNRGRDNGRGARGGFGRGRGNQSQSNDN